jgi:hypothetical protein
MTDVNHTRKNKDYKYIRHTNIRNGYGAVCHDDDGRQLTLQEIQNADPRTSRQRVGRTGNLDKSLHGWSRKSLFADVEVCAMIGNDFSNGHRGMAKAVAGAKKYVRSRIRAKEKCALGKIMRDGDYE